ncbi:uncharacterized protein JCM15063_002427 [Sporobolomyces koalae]|uniref:uncharacterized protein n=1 Tax=Sporobolomyces koalae TaxID=500713 RepID=UPI0031782565
MQPYQFPRALPRSQGSLDLTSEVQPPQQPRPLFVITNATPQDAIPPPSPAEADPQQHLARMTSATRSLLAHQAPSDTLSPPAQHLSITNDRNKTLSRISEYSESAYSADGSSMSRPTSHEPQPRLTPSNSTSTNGTTPTTMSFSFPAPPAQVSPPAPTIALPQIPHSAHDQARATVVSPSPWAYPALPGSPSRSHLPSRPITALTTPLPTSNPSPVPVPISNFANPSTFEHRSESPQYARHPIGDNSMVQLPGRVVVPNPRASYHHSQPSDATAWTIDGKYSTTEKEDPFAAYDAVSIAPSSHAGGESNHRFTLDNNEKQNAPSMLNSILPAKKGANRTLWWCLAILAVIGIAVGTGLGVGLRHLKQEQTQDDGVVGVDSSNISDRPSQSVLLPTASASSSATASQSAPTFYNIGSSSSPSPQESDSVEPTSTAEAFSTTFGYRIGSRTTVVPMSYTIPSAYFTRDDGRIQFTEQVVLPSLGSSGSFTSDLRFRVPEPTETAKSSTTTTSRKLAKRDLQKERKEDKRRWERKTALDNHRERSRATRSKHLR